MPDPVAEQMTVPPGYPKPSKLLSWDAISEKLTAARVYWFGSTRPDGRPHLIPRDGMWIDNALYYGGSEETVHHRNVMANAAVTVHIGDGMEAIIVEGSVHSEAQAAAAAAKLADASYAKYPQYGRMDPKMYEAGVLVLRPRRVLAWTSPGQDETRFRFV
jgi:hypothetical protein